MSKLKKLKTLFDKNKHKKIEKIINREYKHQDIDYLKAIEKEFHDSQLAYPSKLIQYDVTTENLKEAFDMAMNTSDLTLEKVLSEYKSLEDLVKRAKDQHGDKV
jgi:hypothetical protein